MRRRRARSTSGGFTLVEILVAMAILSIALIVYLPVGLDVLVDRSAVELMSRAEGTPLLLGARGSALELVLNSLYFESDAPELSSYAAAERVAESELALAIPLYVRFKARGHPIVGTSLAYLDFRGLRLAAGRRRLSDWVPAAHRGP